MKLIIGCVVAILVILAFVRVASANTENGFAQGYKLGYQAATSYEREYDANYDANRRN